MSPRSANGNLSTGATGVSQLNLRGMGTNRTLVLLDGKRYINAALTSGNSAPDINSFPNALIERVDVVTGGASAAYGSDALSGVVNFVIDHDFTGFKGEVQTGMTKYEDDKSISCPAELRHVVRGRPRPSSSVGRTHAERRHRWHQRSPVGPIACGRHS